MRGKTHNDALPFGLGRHLSLVLRWICREILCEGIWYDAALASAESSASFSLALHCAHSLRTVGIHYTSSFRMEV